MGLGVADLTGIPQIVEGIVGKRAFSNGHRLTAFDRGELIGGGAVQLVASIAMLVRMVGGKPGVSPDEVRPGEVNPGEVNPGEARPGEGRPGEIRPGEERPGEGASDQSAVRAQRLNELVDRLEVDFKNDPLRVAYESEVAALKGRAEALLQERGTSPQALEQTARDMVQARRALGVKYKNATPEPLRDYIYDTNQSRYGDPLGPSFDFLMNKYQGDFMKIIDASTRPNPDINAFMAGFRRWLLEGQRGDRYLPSDVPSSPPPVVPPTRPEDDRHP